jgi:hypothetical protein
MKSDCNESQPCQGSDARVDLESDLLDCTDEERREIILFLRTCLKTRQYVARVDVRKQCRSWFRLRYGAIRSLWINVVTS